MALVDLPERWEYRVDSTMVAISAALGAPATRRLAQGIYLANPNWGNEIRSLVAEEWPDKALFGDDHSYDRNCFGVCDSWGQAVHLIPELWQQDTPYVVGLSLIRRDEQPAEGGWRWHKWGPYIGTQDGSHEYLHDCLDVEQVYCYHIYQLDL